MITAKLPTTCAAGPSGVNHACFQRDAGGSRTHSKNCFAGSRLSVWLQRQLSVLARNRTWTSTFAGLHANPAHPEDVHLLAARRGVEPRLAVSKTAVRSGTLAGCVNQYPDLDLNQGLDLRRVQCNSATPSGHAEPTTGFAPASAANHIQYGQNRSLLSRATSANQHEREESNPVEQFWRLPALPGAHSCIAAHQKWAARVSEGSRTLTSWFTARHAATATPQTPCQSAARPGFEPRTPR